MEMIYLITQGDLMKINQVTAMNAHEFLFAAQYLLRKRSIEAKQRQKKNRKN